MAVGDSGCDATTTRRATHTMVEREREGEREKERRGESTLRLFQNKHTTWTGRIVSWLEACLEIGYAVRTRKARVIVCVSVDWCRSTGNLVLFRCKVICMIADYSPRAGIFVNFRILYLRVSSTYLLVSRQLSKFILAIIIK